MKEFKKIIIDEEAIYDKNACVKCYDENGDLVEEKIIGKGMIENLGGSCVVCDKWVDDYDPKLCCSGFECGCMGQPTEPCVCSNGCWDVICADECWDAIGTSTKEKSWKVI